jgi:hypothetical protein
MTDPSWIQADSSRGSRTHLLDHDVVLSLVDDTLRRIVHVMRNNDESGREPPHVLVGLQRQLKRAEAVHVHAFADDFALTVVQKPRMQSVNLLVHLPNQRLRPHQAKRLGSIHRALLDNRFRLNNHGALLEGSTPRGSSEPQGSASLQSSKHQQPRRSSDATSKSLSLFSDYAKGPALTVTDRCSCKEIPASKDAAKE